MIVVVPAGAYVPEGLASTSQIHHENRESFSEKRLDPAGLSDRDLASIVHDEET